MPLKEQIFPSAKDAPAFPVTALESLASRLRAGGLFLVFLDREGCVSWHDAAAGPFFLKFTLPLLLNGRRFPSYVNSPIEQIADASRIPIWNSLPGVIAAILPHVEKRQTTGSLLLIAKREAFELDEDVVREASRLGVDAAWLGHQAEGLPSYGEQAMVRQAKLLASMTRDLVRLGAFEQEIASLSTQLANSYEELSLIYQVSSGMKVNRSASDFFRQACVDVREVMGVGAMGVTLCGEGSCKQDPVLYADGGISAHVPADKLRRLSDELLAVLRDRKSPLLINDLSKDQRFRWAADFARQLIAVPLQRQDELLGCMFGLDKLGGDFDSVDSKLLNSIANESAIYLENAMLFEDVRDLMMGVLHALTSAVDAKDTYTCGHSERVALLSRRLAEEMQLPPGLIERIYMAGILHDVGKIGVPEAVLHKTGKLTAEEFDQMKKHPLIGARILSDIKKVEDLIPGVLHHHERFDGKGYPAGLSADNIPLMGRIICIADCFDAMTSNRTYRRALPLEVAMIEVRRCAGTQFDPALAEVFLRIDPNQFRSLLSEHQARSPRTVAMPEVKL